ncbi:MAG TPA: cell division protein FtsQ/DivIB [Solirubrobacterales bacterium]|nr:cell division protein FtsQ/DivIB [Solirubrobacterales bacterium]
MRRWALRSVGLILAVIAIAFVAQKVVGDTVVEPRLVDSQPSAVIGSGSEAIAVAADGTLMRWYPVPEDSSLPRLPLDEAPKSGRLAGPVLEQAKVLGAAPPALRRYVERSHYGESGVDVVLDSGIELRFGDASQAARKWRAAAAVLADPELEALDYVDLHAPGRPATYGSGHALPPAP